MDINQILGLSSEAIRSMDLPQLRQISETLNQSSQSIDIEEARLNERITNATATLDQNKKKLEEQFGVTDEASLNKLMADSEEKLVASHAALKEAYQPSQGQEAAPQSSAGF